MNMAAFADTLSRFFDRPVVNLTELKGTYQLELDLSMEDLRNAARTMVSWGRAWAAAGVGRSRRRMPRPTRPASRFRGRAATRFQAGTRKVALDFVVIDHLEKAPTEN